MITCAQFLLIQHRVMYVNFPRRSWNFGGYLLGTLWFIGRSEREVYGDHKNRFNLGDLRRREAKGPRSSMDYSEFPLLDLSTSTMIFATDCVHAQ